jgi:hypothetical protein
VVVELQVTAQTKVQEAVEAVELLEAEFHLKTTL